MSRYVDLDRVLRIVKAEWMRVRDDTVPGDIALQMVEQEIRALPTVDVDALRERIDALETYVYRRTKSDLCIRCSYGVREQGKESTADCRECKWVRDDLRRRIDRVIARLREQDPAPKCGTLSISQPPRTMNDLDGGAS